ncbi:MAG: hypothetical protein SVN78_05380 [Deferribacterota bacterium]|nr:hypothetical protein [Deferribacterota bacterium]
MKISLIQLDVKLCVPYNSLNNINILIDKKVPDKIDLIIFSKSWNTGHRYSNIEYLAELNHREIDKKLKILQWQKNKFINRLYDC